MITTITKRHSWWHTIIHRWLRIPYQLSIRYRRIRRPFATTYVLIHGLADTGALWQPLIKKLPAGSNYLVVDLLGHGKSKHPVDDSVYSASKQARHLLATCLRAGMSGPVVLIGHSFGGLVAVEFAHAYKGIVKQVILVSPPIYRDETGRRRDWLRQERLLRGVYRQALKQPGVVAAGYDISSNLGMLGFSQTNLKKEAFEGFEGTLRAGIINQRAGRYLKDTTVPTTIIYGLLDPLLVVRNFTTLARANQHITTKGLPTGHAMRERTLKEVLRAIAVD